MLEDITRSVLIGVAVAFITPAVILLIRMAVGTGKFTFHTILAPFILILNGLLKIGKYIAIPIAAIVLLSPDSMRTFFPASSTILGICILLVASVYLLYAMFGGLREALAILFWTCICVVVVSAFKLDKMLPQPAGKQIKPSTSVYSLAVPERQLQLLAPRTLTEPPKREMHRSGEDGLDVSSFELNPKPVARKPEESLLVSLTSVAEGHYTAIEQSVADFLSPSMSWVSSSKDQSFQGLPSNMFFEGKKGKKQHFGYFDDAGSSEKDDNSSLIQMIAKFF